MKQYLYFILLLLANVTHAQVQQQSQAASDFVPAIQPVAIREGDSIYMLVGDYWLIQSLRARLNGSAQVSSVKRQQTPNGPVLVYETRAPQINAQRTLVIVPLVFNPQSRQYFAGNNALTCSGCDACKLVEASCVCGTNTTESCLSRSDQAIAYPLSSIRMTLNKE